MGRGGLIVVVALLLAGCAGQTPSERVAAGMPAEVAGLRAGRARDGLHAGGDRHRARAG